EPNGLGESTRNNDSDVYPEQKDLTTRLNVLKFRTFQDRLAGVEAVRGVGSLGSRWCCVGGPAWPGAGPRHADDRGVIGWEREKGEHPRCC
ncbi:MAG: hypothetical protein LC749_17105, partial [Actinobacteria bacterium]|nr:hypothetical protein [Actinomycetota bacterium]